MQKVLVISYYWPPAGGPGVQRWLKFATYLPQYGIQPVLYVPQNAHYPIQDASLENQVPKDLVIYRAPITEPYALASLFSKKKTKQISSGIITSRKQGAMEKLMLWIRGNFFIPDARKNWIKPSIKAILEILEKEQINTIITTGPPHSLHLIGKGLQSQKQLTWIADFRDPWTSIGYHKKLRLMKFAQHRHKALERAVLQAANQIIVTSESCKAEFEVLTQKPITVITNGYEPYKGEEVPLDNRFTLSHIGSLLADRDPKGLWQALSELVAEKDGFAHALSIQLMGVVGEGTQKSLEDFGLTPYCSFLGYRSHTEAREHQMASQVLLLLEIDSEETKGIIPGKLFEYLAAKRPILAIGPPDWEAGTMVSQMEAGKFMQHQNVEAIKSILLEWFHQYQKGKLQVSPIGVEQYSRQALTQKLANRITWE